MVICLSKMHPGKTGLVLALALAALPASPACAVEVGYYDMELGAGNANQVPAITAAGQSAVQLFDLQSSDLSGIDVLLVQNPSNSIYGAEYMSRLSSIEAAVAGGMILVLHDRFVTDAASILPGGSAFAVVRDVDISPSEASDINILDDTSPVVHGVAGILSSTSLDGGNYSNHGYVRADTLPADAKLILWRPDPADALSHNRLVTFSYAYGDGAVVYSTIPLDFYLDGSWPSQPRDNFAGIYAPNVIHYAAVALRPLDFYTLASCRLFDTRGPNGPSGGPALTSSVPRDFQVTGVCDIPETAQAVAVNVTAIQPDSFGFLAAYPDNDPSPGTTSVLNFAAGQTRANNAILSLGPTGGIQILSTLFPGGTVHVVLDVTGYFDRSVEEAPGGGSTPPAAQ